MPFPRPLHAALPLLLLMQASVAAAATGSVDRAARRLAADTGGTARVLTAPATGLARLVVIEPGTLPLKGAASAENRAMAFLDEYGGLFDIHDPARQLELASIDHDALGQRHLSYRQRHDGLPVFAGVLRVHVDSEGRVRAVNGTTIPDLDGLDTTPSLDRGRAEALAIQRASKRSGLPAGEISAAAPELVAFRTNLVRGVPGLNHLAWLVRVEGGGDFAENVFVDAHSGRVLDSVSLVRTVNRAVSLRTLANTVWSEGDPLPYAGSTPPVNQKVNELIELAGDVHTMFRNLSKGAWLSWDGRDGALKTVYLSEQVDCPNALWNGRETHFCDGMAADDVAAHEWTHAYTDGTHDLIYEWQPGALNESYSDIFGETLDLLNGTGTDTPDLQRSEGGCSTFAASPPPRLEVVAPAGIAGPVPAGGATFNPPGPWAVRAPVVKVDDGVGDPWDACQTIAAVPAGSVALVHRGSCNFVDKVLMAQSAGAGGVIMVNNQGDEVLEMGGDGQPDIPSVFVGGADGLLLEAALDQGLEVELGLPDATDASLRWIIGEDTILEGLRDMYSPACFGDPSAVDEGRYVCGEEDGGGVHTNSGVPNHVYALVVDGGRSHGVDVRGIGLAKAAHVYWRAMSVYQVPTTDFGDHADLLELSCQDLVGAPLRDLLTGGPAGDTIDADDCRQLSMAIAAAGLRTPPTQCGFEALLSPDPPPPGRTAVFDERFESAPWGEWTRSNHGVYSEYLPRDWEWTADPPAGADGGALFAADGIFVGDCRPGSDDQSGVVELDSPAITLSGAGEHFAVVFDHWVATEAGYDGGNVSLSVNGGPFALVPAESYAYNPYNDVLRPAAEGNTNPLAGQQAFTGTDDGGLDGSWGQSQVDLDGLAQAGDEIVIRFSFGTDGCAGIEGWYLDRVRVMTDPAPRRGGGRLTASGGGKGRATRPPVGGEVRRASH